MYKYMRQANNCFTCFMFKNITELQHVSGQYCIALTCIQYQHNKNIAIIQTALLLDISINGHKHPIWYGIERFKSLSIPRFTLAVSGIYGHLWHFSNHLSSCNINTPPRLWQQKWVGLHHGIIAASIALANSHTKWVIHPKPTQGVFVVDLVSLKFARSWSPFE